MAPLKNLEITGQMEGSGTTAHRRSAGVRGHFHRSLVWGLLCLGILLDRSEAGVESMVLAGSGITTPAGARSLALLGQGGSGSFQVYPTLASVDGGQDLVWFHESRGLLETMALGGQWGAGSLSFESDLESHGNLGFGIRYQYESFSDATRDALGTVTGSFLGLDSLFQAGLRYTFKLGREARLPEDFMALSLGIGFKYLRQDFGQTVSGTPSSTEKSSGFLMGLGLGVDLMKRWRFHVALDDLNLVATNTTNGMTVFPITFHLGLAHKMTMRALEHELGIGWESAWDGRNGSSIQQVQSVGWDASLPLGKPGRTVQMLRTGGGIQVKQDWMNLDNGFGAGIHGFLESGTERLVFRVHLSIGYQTIFGWNPALHLGLHWRMDS